ncbi:MAG TPA: hypothetical protein VGQ17_13045 [Gemmatimonadales bacterium]|nr:hypothetical protein [Gemmatimonadales bacterium]
MRRFFGTLAPAVVPMIALAAQQGPAAADHKWAVGLVVGTSSFSGAAVGTGPNGEDIRFVPHRPGITGLRFSRGGGGLRLAVSAQFGRPGLGLHGVPGAPGEADQGGVLIVEESVYRLWSFGAGASTRLLRFQGAASLRPSLGLELQRWSASGSPSRLILGGEAGMGLEVPLTGSFVAEFTGVLGFTPRSPFRQEDVPEATRLRSTWRRSIMGAVHWRF